MQKGRQAGKMAKLFFAVIKKIKSRESKQVVQIKKIFLHEKESKQFSPLNKFDFDNFKNKYYLEEKKGAKRCQILIVALGEGE